MSRQYRDRRGIALFAALGLIAIMGLLISGAIATSTFAQRTARLELTSAALDAGAEFALNSVLSDARLLNLSSAPLGRPMTIMSYSSVDARIAVTATRLPSGVVWLVAEAHDAHIASGDPAGARRRVHMVARWRVPGVVARAGVMAAGDVRVGSGVTFSRDSTGDAECSIGASRDVAVGPGSRVLGVDSSRVAVGSIDSMRYYVDTLWRAQLDSVDGVVHVRGDTTIVGGSFEGLLLVDGTVRITGPFALSGLVVSQGKLDASAGSMHVSGALLSFARPPAGEFAVDLSNATIRFSTCVVSGVLRHALPLRPVRLRSWGELF